MLPKSLAHMASNVKIWLQILKDIQEECVCLGAGWLTT